MITILLMVAGVCLIFLYTWSAIEAFSGQGSWKLRFMIVFGMLALVSPIILANGSIAILYGYVLAIMTLRQSNTKIDKFMSWGFLIPITLFMFLRLSA